MDKDRRVSVEIYNSNQDMKTSIKECEVIQSNEIMDIEKCFNDHPDQQESTNQIFCHGTINSQADISGRSQTIGRIKKEKSLCKETNQLKQNQS